MRRCLAIASLQYGLLYALNPSPPPQSFVWPSSSSRNDFKEGRVFLDPLTQNIPEGSRHRGKRPPEPRVPEIYDVFLGLPSYRDGIRCGYTIWSAFYRAENPYRVHVGLVDQTQDEDVRCIDEYCRLAKESWPNEECKYRNQIKVDARDSKFSNGPISVRAGMQKLIGEEEFCLTIDAHSLFLANWDTILVSEWKRTNNEMAVLSVYPPGYDKIGPNFTIPEKQTCHLCHFGGHESFTDMPWFTRVTIDDSEYPQMSPFWGGGLSFSKCHAERRVPIDPYLVWIFIGEEFIRAMQLWTQGYDIYSPSRHGTVVFHNETKQGGHNGSFWKNAANFPDQANEAAQAYERLKMIMKFEVKGPVNGKELSKYYPRRVRSIDAYLDFCGVSPVDVKLDRWKCEQLHWVPYTTPEIIEEFLPGYQMYNPSRDTLDILRSKLRDTSVEDDTNALVMSIDKAEAKNDGQESNQLLEEIYALLKQTLEEYAANLHAIHDTNREWMNNIQKILEHLEGTKTDPTIQEIKHQMQQLSERNLLGDYKNIIALQVFFVIGIIAFFIWRSRSSAT